MIGRKTGTQREAISIRVTGQAMPRNSSSLMPLLLLWSLCPVDTAPDTASVTWTAPAPPLGSTAIPSRWFLNGLCFGASLASH